MTDQREQVTGREIGARLTGLAHAFFVGRLRAGDLITELRAIADWLEGGTKPAKPAKEEVTTQVEGELFQYWQAVFGKERATFTPERRRVIRARLRDGYTAQDIRRAIDGCKASDFHNGINNEGRSYNDITLICRNGTKLESFRDLAKEHGAKPLAVNGSEEKDAQIAQLAADGLEALKKGDMNAHNRAQEEITRLRSGKRDAGSLNRQAG
jgi:hypothetical protein